MNVLMTGLLHLRLEVGNEISRYQRLLCIDISVQQEGEISKSVGPFQGWQ